MCGLHVKSKDKNRRNSMSNPVPPSTSSHLVTDGYGIPVNPEDPDWDVINSDEIPGPKISGIALSILVKTVKLNN